MGDFDGYDDRSHPGVRARDRALCFVRCIRRIWLRIQLGCVSDVRVSMTLRFRVMGKHGLCQWLQ